MKHTRRLTRRKQRGGNMEEVIADLKKRYRMTEDEIRKTLSPEFDIAQWKSHPHIDVELHGEIFEIDEKIVNLFKLVNKYEINTTQSCQHNMFGWANLIFTCDGYMRFVNKILEKAREKYKDNWEKIYDLDIISRFEFNTRDNNKQIYSQCLLFDGEEQYTFQISVDFVQSEIPKLEADLLDLFTDK